MNRRRQWLRGGLRDTVCRVVMSQPDRTAKRPSHAMPTCAYLLSNFDRNLTEEIALSTMRFADLGSLQRVAQEGVCARLLGGLPTLLGW